MKLKITLIFALLIFGIQTSFAQDIIYKKNGTSEKVKLKEISERSITYKRWNNLEGPDFVVPTRDITKIRYENGTEETIARDGKTTPAKKNRPQIDYGKNILAVAPLFMTNTSAIGVGLSYERIMGKKAMFSFHLPVGYSFDATYNSSNKVSTMFWAYPGAKFYPTGNNGVARFAIGPSLIIGAGNEQRGDMIFDPFTQTSRYQETNRSIFLMGLMFNASLNIQPSAKVYFGPQLGLGFPFFVNGNALDGSETYPMFFSGEPLPIVQFRFNVGYRF